jgi:zinc protease
MRDSYLHGLLVLLVAAGLTAPGAIDTAEAAAPEKIIESTVLDNGLKIISIEDPSLPIVTIEMALRHGAFAETPEFDGLSHLYEHMFFKGNAAIPDQEAYLQRIKELGIVFNGTTSTERVNYFFTLPTANLRKGMEFMEHAIRTPKFEKGEFAKEKKIVLSEYDRAESNPSYAFQRTMQRKLWYEYPSRKITLGSREAIANATIEQMREIKDTYYVPNNASLIVAGDVSADRAFELGKQVFGDWPKGDNPFETNPVPEHPPLKDKEIFIQEGEVKVPTVDLRWHGPSVDDSPEATYAADVLSFILSQPSSTFYKELVDSEIALSANLSYYTQAHTGPIMARASVRRDNIREAVEALLTQLHRLADPDYFTDQQLANAKTILETRDIYSREKTSQYAHTVSFWWAVDDIDYYLDYVENLNEVTRKDIASYVQEYILTEPYVLGVLMSPRDTKAIDLTEEELRTMVADIEAKLENGGTDQ